jgi:Flp pilus assembly protein TadG
MTTKIDVRRKGVVLVFVAIVLVCVIGIIALALDIGYLYNVKADLQVAADAAALAGAGGLCISQAEARARAIDIAKKNYANGMPVVLQNSDVKLGLWDSVTGFTAVNSPTVTPNAVKVDANLVSVKTIFASAIGIKSVPIGASAIAVFGARDIVLSIDYSRSMSFDSQPRRISMLPNGQNMVEQSLRNIWQDLGSHTYGNMQFPPNDYVNKTSTNYNTIRDALGLRNVTYPYQSGSWSEYFQVVQAQRYANPPNPQYGWQTEWTSVDAATWNSKYRYHYNYFTLMYYLQDVQYQANETPDLWKTREQPLTAVKDAVTLFLAYMDEVPTNDRVGLVSYTYTNGDGHLEQQLTADYTLIESRSRHMQAGHYRTDTSIAGGIETALTELRTHGRTGALQVIVLLSDGHTNVPSNGAESAALDQAYEAADRNIPILTISLGADADTDLMQQIAEISNGAYFVIPGGQSVDQYKDQLNTIFAQIASRRPLRLVN